MNLNISWLTFAGFGVLVPVAKWKSKQPI